jgi:type I restriction enzyme S subunit
MFYKETEFRETPIGKIPKDWEITKMGDVAFVKGRIGWRGLKASEYTTKGPYLIANKHLINNKIMWDECDHLSEFRYDESPEIQLQLNDVIMSKDGTIGQPAFIDFLPDRATINSTMMLLRVTNDGFAPEFLFYSLQGPHFKRFLAQKISGTSIPHLFQRDMKELKVILPPLSEQRAIVGVLGVVDLAVAKAGEVIAKTERLKKGLMQELLTKGIGHKEYKQTPIGTVPQEWEIDALPDLFKVIDYRGRTPPFSESGIPYIGSNNIRNERIVLDDKRYVSEQTYEKYMTRGIPNEGDILFTTEAPLGEVAIIPRNLKFCFAQRLVALQCKKEHNSRFLMYMLRSSIVQKQLSDWATGTTVKGISAKNMKFIRIPYSEDVEEQRKIAETLSAVDKKLELEKNEKARLERIRQGLMDLLLIGKVRVKVD